MHKHKVIIPFDIDHIGFYILSDLDIIKDQ